MIIKIEGESLLRSSGSSAPPDPLKDEWYRRELEIEDKILFRVLRKTKEPLIGQGGEPLLKKQRRRKHKKPKLVYSVVNSLSKPLIETVQNQEARDEKAIIFSELNPEDTVCKILGDYEIGTLVTALGKVGERGKIQYASSAPNLKDEVFKNIFSFLVNFRQLKGEINGNRDFKPYHQSIGLNNTFLNDAGKFLSLPYLEDLDFYLAKYNGGGNLRDLFYHTFPLTVINSHIPPLQIKNNSVDILLELDRFVTVPEEKKQELLLEMDRILKPGGKLLIRENSHEQALIEYYGKELFKKYRRKICNAKLKHPYRWIMLEKITQGVVETSQLPEIERELTICSQEHNWNFNRNGQKNYKQIYRAVKHMLEKKHKIDNKIIGGYEIDDSLKESLSISFFKKAGLLSLLATEFDGNVEKLVDFLLNYDYLKKNGHLSFPVEIQEPSHMAHDPKPSNIKAYYTIDDLVGELKIAKGEIKERLKKSGIKGLKSKGFSPSARANKILRFSYSEYIIIKDILKKD